MGEHKASDQEPIMEREKPRKRKGRGSRAGMMRCVMVRGIVRGERRKDARAERGAGGERRCFVGMAAMRARVVTGSRRIFLRTLKRMTGG